MREVHFKSVTAKNFLSIGETPVTMEFRTGLNIITGINRDEDDIKNGTGKSTLTEAFFFGLFGSTLREISTKKYIVNRQNHSKCVVMVDFDIIDHGRVNSYHVERGITPAFLRLIRNGENITKSTIAETNKEIANILILNEEVFRNCIIMRANNCVPFMAKKKAEKKSFIESVFNLNVFTQMYKRMREDLKRAKVDYDLHNTKYSIYQTNYESAVERLRSGRETIEQQLENTKKSLQDKITASKEELARLESEEWLTSEEVERSKKTAEENRDGALAAYNAAVAAKNQLGWENQNYTKQNNEYSVHSTSCPLCHREYDDSHKKIVADKISENEGKIAENDKLLEQVEEKITEYNRLFNAYVSELNQWYNYGASLTIHNNAINTAKNNISSYENEIAALNQDGLVDNYIANLVNEVEEAKAVVESEKLLLDVASAALEKFNCCEQILGEAGIRVYLVKRLLEILNARIDYHLRSFKSMFRFTFDEFFDEELTDASGVKCLYGNCSGAEAKKIDLAVSFAFIDMLRIYQGVDYNVSFYDEILDSSVDDKSLEIIIQQIVDSAEKRNHGVYIITHKTGLNLPTVNETIVLYKEGGFTYRT